MKNQFSLFDLLLIIGITQGIITSILLLVSKKNSKSNLFLAFALIAFCFLSTKTLLHTLHLWDVLYFRYFPNGVELVIAPLIYFYIVSLVNPRFKFRRKDILHFIPFILSQTYAFVVYFTVFNIHEIQEKDVIADLMWFDNVKRTEDHLALISIVVYLLLGYKELKRYRAWLHNTISDNTFPDFNWLKNILLLSTILGLFLFINLSLDILFNLRVTYNFHWEAYIIFVSFLIYYLGLVGYKQPNYQFVEHEKPSSNSKKLKLSDQKETEALNALKNALQNDKVFLNPSINIQQLSNSLGIPQRHLSYVINNFFQKNFRDLINEYRVEEVKSKLNSIAYKHMSILGIALECGFNSEASFYRIFKKNTGISPKEYIQHIHKD